MKSDARRLADHEVLPRLATVVAHDRATTVEMLELIGRAEAARLYANTPHDSMFAYCVGELHMSEDMAYKRIRVARKARKFPAIIKLLADGRLHLSGAYLLAPHLRRENARELLEAATHRSKAEIEKLLAVRFPKSALPAFTQPLGSPVPANITAMSCQLAPGPVAATAPDETSLRVASSAPMPETPVTGELAPGPVALPAPLARITPLAPDCTGVQFAFGDQALEKLRYARALLGHAVPSGDLAEIFERALDALIAKQEKTKFAVTSRLKPGARGKSANPHYVPAPVRREVLERDEGRCTYVCARGERCASQNRLEFDHVIPVAKGGESTVPNLRLRCRTHNQHAADQAFGAGFMARKREAAKRNAEAKRRAESASKAELLRREGYARELAANEEARARALAEMPWLGRHQLPAVERGGEQPGARPPA